MNVTLRRRLNRDLGLGPLAAAMEHANAFGPLQCLQEKNISVLGECLVIQVSGVRCTRGPRGPGSAPGCCRFTRPFINTQIALTQSLK